MRDGVHLAGTAYRPKDAGPLPVILTMTPYNSDTYHERAWYFARNGYNYALVDTRGRGDSDGDWVPNATDAADGYDTVEWLAAQPFCDGHVGMWGGAYAGLNQWQTLKAAPPHLTTIVPAAAANFARYRAFRGPVRSPHMLSWLTFVSHQTVKWNLMAERDFWFAKRLELYRSSRPFGQLESFVGKQSRHFKTWIAHKPHDPFWEKAEPTREHYERMNIPVLNIAGIYDECQAGHLEYAQNLYRWGPAEARERQYVLIGPWSTAGTRTPEPVVGGVPIGKAGLMDLNQLHCEWYDWTMKGGPRPEFLKKRVAYYVMGAEEWKYADHLDSITDATRRLYLHSDGIANDVRHSGRLQGELPADSPPDRFVHDPLDSRYAELELVKDPADLTDEREELNLFGNGLVYHTAPFEEETEVSGWPRLVLWMAMDVPDADFYAYLCEILPDGTRIRVWDAVLRARYRNGLEKEELVTPGETIRYDLDERYFFSRLVHCGSRLRLVIKCPNSIHWQKNYHSGGDVDHESGADARTATITVYHDADHPSYLELPLVTRRKRT
jgi:putative CocE/NonD family hydrolase